MKALDGVIDQAMLTWKLFFDARVPIHAKLILVLAVVYIVSPIDLVPDIIPVLTQLDDLGILVASVKFMEMLAPDYVVSEHRAAIERRRAGSDAEVVDAPGYRSVDGEKPKNG
jgi:uncharacterized membrane protein YkvA (DUF1232 family)